MKITPLEIRQKTFEKEFRGFDKEEVNAFLLSLSQEWERVVEDYKEVKYRLEIAEKEVSKLRDVEASLFKTLKTAEDTGNNLVEQANKKAELHVREAELKAETILNNAKSKAREIVENAEMRARNVVETMEGKLRQLEQNYRILESHRDNLLSDLIVLSNNTLERVEQAEAKIRKHDIDGIMNAGQNVAKSVKESHYQEQMEEERRERERVRERENTNTDSEGKDKSFFDDIQ